MVINNNINNKFSPIPMYTVKVNKVKLVGSRQIVVQKIKKMEIRILSPMYPVMLKMKVIKMVWKSEIRIRLSNRIRISQY